MCEYLYRLFLYLVIQRYMLLELRELQKNTKEYLGKEIEINGWVKKLEVKKTSDLLS